jgi:16S rRNA (adenine1518-N6/adenine1519-N6)-dimethyltransferase
MSKLLRTLSVQYLRQLHVLEIDRDIIKHLENDYPKDKLLIHAGDALKFDLAEITGPLRIVGNLPYNISSPLLFHFSNYAERIIDMHFMLQNEVVERMVAEPSTPAYGRLSVMLQYRFYMEKLLDVPPESFRPSPKVDSAIVRMIPLPMSDVLVRDEKLFSAVVATAFGQRRKTLRNTLKSYLHEADFEKLGIDAQLRAENLGVPEFARISDFVADGDKKRG